MDSKPRLLVVDDTPDNLFLMQALLEDLCEVATADSGAQALQAVRAGPPPDLILLDVLMPGMDGYEVLRQLRQDGATAAIPVIFLTALTSIDEEQRGIDLGAADYIGKPISPPVVLARVQAHLERSRQARVLRELPARLGRYLPPHAVAALLDGVADPAPSVQRKTVTVLSAGIADFHAATAGLPAEQVQSLLNSALTEMARTVQAHGATLDRFDGAGLRAYVGDAGSQGVRGDALRSVSLALALQRQMAALAPQWRAMGAVRPFSLRCGLHTGTCDLGTFGSAQRMDVTLLGEDVDRAARLAQAAEPGGILVSAATHALVHGEVVADACAPLATDGIVEALRAYAIRDVAPARDTADRRVDQWERFSLQVLATAGTQAAALH